MDFVNTNKYRDMYVQNLGFPLEVSYEIVEKAYENKGLNVFFGTSSKTIGHAFDIQNILYRMRGTVPNIILKKDVTGIAIHHGSKSILPNVNFIFDDQMNCDEIEPDGGFRSTVLECDRNQTMVPLRAKGIRLEYCDFKKPPLYKKLADEFLQMPIPHNEFAIGFRVNNPRYSCMYLPFSNPPERAVSSVDRHFYSQRTYQFFTEPIYYDNLGLWSAQAIDYISKGNSINDNASVFDYCENELCDNPEKAAVHLRRGAKRAFNLIDAFTCGGSPVDDALAIENVPSDMGKKFLMPLLCKCKKMLEYQPDRIETVIKAYNSSVNDNITIDDFREAFEARYF